MRGRIQAGHQCGPLLRDQELDLTRTPMGSDKISSNNFQMELGGQILRLECTSAQQHSLPDIPFTQIETPVPVTVPVPASIPGSKRPRIPSEIVKILIFPYLPHCRQLKAALNASVCFSKQSQGSGRLSSRSPRSGPPAPATPPSQG